MVPARRLCNISRIFSLILASSLVFGHPGHAAEANQGMNFKGIYEIRFGGILFGKVGFEAEQTASNYSATADVSSSSIVNLFSKHSSHSNADATGKNYDYTQIDYDTHYSIKKKKRAVKLTYKNGAVTAEDVQPPDNRAKRPAVTDKEKKDSADPLSGILKVRLLLKEAVKSGATSITTKIYDGRRLTKFDGTLLKKRTIVYNKKPLPVIVLSAKRTPLAGFTESEIKDYSPKEPPLLMYFSDDERMIPIRFEITFMFGTLTAALVKECATGESCLLGVKP